MPKRPRLTDESFLKSVFQPSKNAIPAGIRKSSVKSNGGRKASRVRSYNGLSAQNQEILRRTGNRDQYLKGTVSLADAKRQLRQEAVKAHIVKPLGATTRRAQAIANLTAIASNRPERPNASAVSPETIKYNVNNRMSERQITAALNFNDYDDLIDAMDDGYDADGYNVYWYK